MWIKLHRKITEWEWYSDANTMRLYIHLLLSANWQDKEWDGMTIERGQLVTSVRTLCKQLNISLQECRTALKHLVSSNNIEIQSSSTNTLITIVKYDDYQLVESDTQEVTQKITQIATHKSAQLQTQLQSSQVTETKAVTDTNPIEPTQKATQKATQIATHKLTTTKEYLKNIQEYNTKEKNIKEKESVAFISQNFQKKFLKPSLADIQTYCNERDNSIDPECFFDFYESKGWKVGSSPMKDWKAAVRTWERKGNYKPRTEFHNSDVKEYHDNIL